MPCSWEAASPCHAIHEVRNAATLAQTGICQHAALTKVKSARASAPAPLQATQGIKVQYAYWGNTSRTCCFQPGLLLCRRSDQRGPFTSARMHMQRRAQASPRVMLTEHPDRAHRLVTADRISSTSRVRVIAASAFCMEKLNGLGIGEEDVLVNCAGQRVRRRFHQMAVWYAENWLCPVPGPNHRTCGRLPRRQLRGVATGRYHTIAALRSQEPKTPAAVQTASDLRLVMNARRR